jgi:hypothetical protein
MGRIYVVDVNDQETAALSALQSKIDELWPDIVGTIRVRVTPKPDG